MSGQHAGHDLANLTSASHQGGPVGRLVCLDCDAIIEQLRAEGLAVSAATVAARLCPWSGDGG